MLWTLVKYLRQLCVSLTSRGKLLTNKEGTGTGIDRFLCDSLLPLFLSPSLTHSLLSSQPVSFPPTSLLPFFWFLFRQAVNSVFPTFQIQDMILIFRLMKDSPRPPYHAHSVPTSLLPSYYSSLASPLLSLHPFLHPASHAT